ncbi:MAG: hypothetical protein HY447_01150 [Candidatus Omnitrophica bacterium]|nr:hypothetical protein [Candidatus Omnitrophota bacterium]
MKIRWVVIGITLFLVGLLLAAGSFSLWRLLRDPETLKTRIVSQLENSLGARLSFKEMKVAFKPFPFVRARELRLESTDEKFPTLEAKEAQFSFRFLPLLWGQISLASIEVGEGKGIFRGVPLEHIDFHVRGMKPKRSTPFDVSIKGESEKEVIHIKGDLVFENSGDPFWLNLMLNANITAKDFSLTEGAGKNFLKQFSKSIPSGNLNGFVKVKKEKGEEEVKGVSQFDLGNFKLGTAEPISVSGETEFVWNLKSDAIEWKRFLVKAPFFELDGKGIFNADTGEIQETRITGRKVVLEELVKRFPNLQSFLPPASGFSGEGEFDLTLQGTWDYLSIHSNCNLAPASLNYGKFFSKPKDLPLVINSDLLLKEASALSGDFSIRIQQLTVKGALSGVDLKTGEGELTLITNKFELEGWESLVPPFAEHKVSGAAKILLSFKGNLMQLDKAKRQVNLTLENVGFLSSDGQGIQKANVLLDLSPLNLRLKETSFVVNDSMIQVGMEIYDLAENPQGTIKIVSPNLDPFALWDTLKKFSPPFSNGSFLRFFPKSTRFEDFSLNVKIQEKKLILDNLTFGAFEGSFNFQGEMDLLPPEENPLFWVQVGTDRVSLSRYFESVSPSEKILEGNLFFKGKFQGLQGKPDEISGQGSVSITNGEWHSLDFISPLKGLAPFRSLASSTISSTLFDDLKASWTYKGKKFDTVDFLFSSEELWVEGKGNVSLEGVLNSGLELYLSRSLTQKMFDVWEARYEPGTKRLGPIPFVLVGTLRKPDARIDEDQISRLLEAIQSQRFRKILHDPFKGD